MPKENEKSTVIRFDRTCTIELKISDDKVSIIKYNEIDGSKMKLTGKLKEIKENG